MHRLLLGLENKLAEYNGKLLIVDRGLKAGHRNEEVILGFIMNPEAYERIVKAVKPLEEQCPVSKAIANSTEYTKWSWNECLYFIEPFDEYRVLKRGDWIDFNKEEEEEQ